MRVAQILSLQVFIKSAMFSSEYTDFFGLAAPAAGQTISRTCLKAMLRFHTIFHATPKAYLDDWKSPVAFAYSPVRPPAFSHAVMTVCLTHRTS